MTEVTRTRSIVVITGGSACIGRATVREFADAGYDNAVLARGRAGLDGGRHAPVSFVASHRLAPRAAAGTAMGMAAPAFARRLYR